MTTGPCELLAQIGAGPDGVAYRARQHGEEGVVEVRLLAPARADAVRWEQLVRRLHLARLIDHPGTHGFSTWIWTLILRASFSRVCQACR